MAIKTIFHILGLGAALALAACAAKGPNFNSADFDKPVANKARVFVYRPSGFTIFTRSPRVEVNGMPHCDLSPGHFFVATIDPGKTTIAASLWDMPGTSRLSFDTYKENDYYVRLAQDGGKAIAGMGFGLMGLMVAETTSETGGPFTMKVMDTPAAHKDIVETKKTEDCKKR